MPDGRASCGRATLLLHERVHAGDSVIGRVLEWFYITNLAIFVQSGLYFILAGRSCSRVRAGRSGSDHPGGKDRSWPWELAHRCSTPSCSRDLS